MSTIDVTRKRLQKWITIDQTSGRHQLGLAIGGLVATFLIWEVITVTLNLLPPVILPGPSEIIAVTIQHHNILWFNAQVTIFSAGMGFIIAATVGFLSALALVWNKTVNKMLYPLIIAGNSVPRIAIAPLIIFYVGGGEQYAHLAIAAWVAYFSMVVNTYDGLKVTNEDVQLMLASFDATFWQELKWFRFQSALPHIFDGLKVTATGAVVGAVIGEFVAASRGLGFLTMITMRGFQIPLTFAAVMSMSFLALFGFFAIFIIQDRVIHWKSTSLLPQ